MDGSVVGWWAVRGSLGGVFSGGLVGGWLDGCEMDSWVVVR